MNIKYAKDKLELEWGEVTQEDILRRIHNHKKSVEEMSEQEINQMLDDLI